jgi:hypothetical protein
MAAERELDNVDAQLEELSAALSGQQTLGTRALTDAAEALGACLQRVRALRAEASSWSGDTPQLAALDARADENLALAERALESAGVAESSERARFDLQDAVFHARRCVELTRRLGDEVRQLTRQVDREKNRLEFMSG